MHNPQSAAWPFFIIIHFLIKFIFDNKALNIKKVFISRAQMTYLAGLHVIKVKTLFHADWLVPTGCASYWPTAERGKDGKTQQSPPCTIEASCWRVFLTPSMQVTSHVVLPPPPSCTVSPLFSRSRTSNLMYTTTPEGPLN
jgi:hypothetical protein